MAPKKDLDADPWAKLQREKLGKGGPKGITTKQIADALERSYGIYSGAARILGTTPQNIGQRVKKSAKLRKVAAKARELFIDECETGLIDLVKDRDRQAIFFGLNNLGKARGYGRKWWEDDPRQEPVDEIGWTDPGPPEIEESLEVDPVERLGIEELPNGMTREDLGLNGKGASGNGDRINGTGGDADG